MNINDTNAQQFADHFLGSRISSQHIDGVTKATPLVNAFPFQRESSELGHSFNNTN